MTEPRPLKVFLCHASADKPAVRKLYRYLKQRGVSPWLDEMDLLPGENWEVEIPRALFESDVILACLSKNSVDKEGYVQKEITFALDKAMEKPEGTIFIIPVKLEECNVPQRLNRYHWVDLYHEDGRKRLMLSLNKRAAQLGAAIRQASVTDDSTGRVERDAVEKAAREKAECEAAEKAAREKAGREAAEKAEQEKAEREAAEKVAREKAECEAAEKARIKKEEIERRRLPYFEPQLVRKSVIQQNRETLNSLKKPSEGISLGESPKRYDFRKIGFIVVILMVLVLGALGIDYAINHWPAAVPPIVSEKDGMMLVFVPAGEFTMGDSSDSHKVTLDSFWIDQTEVTNKMYALCVDAGICQPPSSTSSYTRKDYYGNSEFDDYPVIYVDWNKAKTYCEWAGRRLPTEAEWEKAARGTDGRKYPWGENIDCTLANYYDGSKYCVGDTSKVGSYLGGASIYGALDMAGNVWEWVVDWYDAYPGNTTGNSYFGTTYRVLRGGAWVDLGSSVRSAVRDRSIPAYAISNIGFRCARSLP